MTQQSDARPLTPADRLRQAARAVEQVIDTLDLSYTTCQDCGHRHFKNKEHGKLNEQLGPMPERMRAQADRLDELNGVPKPTRISRDGRRLG